MLSAAYAECGSLYINISNVVPFIITLWDHRQPQQPIIIQTKNSIVFIIMNKRIKIKWSRAFDMRHWWLVHCIEQS